MAVTYNLILLTPFIDRLNYEDLSFEGTESLEDGKFNENTLNIDLEDKYLEIPVIAFGQTLKTLHDNELASSDSQKFSSIDFPLVIASRSLPDTKSSQPMLKKIFRDCYSSELYRIKCGNSLYYGGNGVILYSNMEPLLMYYIGIERLEPDTSNFTVRYQVKKMIVKINPRVFTDVDIISKHVRSKMLGSLLTMKDDTAWNIRHSGIRSILSNVRFLTGGLEIKKEFTIVIDSSISTLFTKTTTPNASFNSKLVNNMILNHIDDFTDIL